MVYCQLDNGFRFRFCLHTIYTYTSIQKNNVLYSALYIESSPCLEEKCGKVEVKDSVSNIKIDYSTIF